MFKRSSLGGIPLDFSRSPQRLIFHYLSHFSEIQVASGEWINGGGGHASAAAPNAGRHYVPRHNGISVNGGHGHPLPNQLGGVVKGKGANLYVSATPAELVRRGNVKRSWTISSE